MKKLILLFVLVLFAIPLFAQDEGGGGGGGIFGGGDLAANAPNAPAVDRLVSLKKILTDGGAPLTPAQDKSINAMVTSEIKKYTADLEKKFPEEVAAARATAAPGPGGRGGGRPGGGGGGAADGGGGGGGRPGGGGGRGPGGGRGGAPALPTTGPLATEMARINVELQAKVTDALTPDQKAAVKKHQNDLIRKGGGFAAMKLDMQEAGTPLTVEQESQISALYTDQDQQLKQLNAGGQTPDPAKVQAVKAQIGPKLLKVLNAEQKKTLLDSMKKQQTP